jgi:MFS family permease
MLLCAAWCCLVLPAECAFLTTGQAVVADVFPPAFRGMALGIFMMSVVSNSPATSMIAQDSLGRRHRQGSQVSHNCFTVVVAFSALGAAALKVYCAPSPDALRWTDTLLQSRLFLFVSACSCLALLWHR